MALSHQRPCNTRPAGPASATSRVPDEVFQLLLDALNASECRQETRAAVSARKGRRYSSKKLEEYDSGQTDIVRIRHLLHEAASFNFQAQRRRRSIPSPSSTQQYVEHVVRLTSNHNTRTAIKATRRLTANKRRLLEFSARITHISATGTAAHAISADVCQLATANGVLSLPPSISYSAVIHPDADIFRLVDHDDIHGVQRLLQSGRASIRDCDSFGRNVLHRAAWNSNAELWAMLITEGADLDSVTALCSSALLLCRGLDYLQKLRIALEAGADPTLLPGGQFHLAQMGADAVRTILRISEAYIDVSLRDTDGRTLLLHTAVATSNKDQPSVLRLLLRAGAAVADQDPEGNNCLHLLVSTMRSGEMRCVDSLVILFQAGADPYLLNHRMESVMDIACRPSAEFGSFRRDALHQALLRSGYAVTDERLLAPPRYTQSYTDCHHALLHDRLPQAERSCVDLKASLLSKLIDCVDCSGALTGYRLHETAVDRVLSLYAGLHAEAHPHELFSVALRYLRLLIEGKKQLVIMIKDRLPYQLWRPYGQRIDWLRLVEETETAALLDFDWFKPVDYEDLFLSQVDGLIQQLEEFALRYGPGENIGPLIDVLENALPSHREVCQREKAESDPATLEVLRQGTRQLPTIVTLHTPGLPGQADSDDRVDSLSPEERPRQLSMTKTPIEFYSPPITTESGTLAPGLRALASSRCESMDFEFTDAQMCLAAGSLAREGRRGTRLVC